MSPPCGSIFIKGIWEGKVMDEGRSKLVISQNSLQSTGGVDTKNE